MIVFYSPHYYADIGANHVFPIRKFERVRDLLLAEGTLRQSDIVEPVPARVEDVQLVHTEDYVTRLRAGALTAREIRRLGLPWSKALVRRSFYAVGGTIAAARHALSAQSVGSNLAGGTHHAFADRGEGFCVFNDVAVAIQVLRREGLIETAAVIDCDVHQGNGTAAIFEDDPQVFTFSMHGAKNYPLFKMRSSLDIELPDKTTDDVYLTTLAESLATVLTQNYDIIFYLAGADPFERDKLGRLALTKAGLQARDEMVLRAAREHRTPVVTTMSGGYAADINDTVEIHANTIRAVKRILIHEEMSGRSETRTK